MGRLDGKTAIVTGASRGLGAVIAQVFAEEGAAVVVAARTLEEGTARHPGSVETVSRRIQESGGRTLAVGCDVSNEHDRIELVERSLQAFGAVDILVNNAAAFGNAPFLALPLRRFERCFDVNVFAAYHLMQLVLPGMVERRSGWIVNVTSDASRRPPPGPYAGSPQMGGNAYGVPKLALEHLTRGAASEFHVHNVAVNALMPSMPVPTPSMLDAVPHLEEYVTAESFAEAAVRLASCDPSVTNGLALYSEDVLHPELGTRGWLAGSL